MYYLLLLVLVFYIVYKKWKNTQMSKIPRPPSWPIIGNITQILDSPENAWNSMQKFNKEYYPIYQLSSIFLTVVHLNDPNDIEILLTSKIHLRKAKIYEWLRLWLGTGLLTSDGAKWQYRRKLLTPAFHFNILQEFSKIFIDHSKQLVYQLQNECHKPHTNIIPLITQFTLHTICETAMGTKLDETKKANSDFVLATYKMGELLINRLSRPWLFINLIYRASKLQKEQTYLLNILHSFSKSVIENRKQNFKESDIVNIDGNDWNYRLKKRHAMLDLLLSLRQHGIEISDEGIREEVDTFIFEGHDTTSAGLSFALMLIANHSDVQEKIIQEINDVMNGSDRQFDYFDIQQMRYLEMVIKESQRLYPSVPMIGRRIYSDLITSTGYTIPKDTLVSVQIYGLHHNPRFYPDPEKFDPDRFLPENIKGRHPFSYIPFSAGPRNCIGQKFAMLELKTAIASIIRKFILLPIDKPSDIKLITHLIIKASSEIRVKFQQRK